MLFLLLILLFIFSAVPVKADIPKFKTDLTVDYIFSASGSSTVKEYFTVTNLTSQYLTPEYDYPINGDIPNNLKAFDSRGPLKIITEKNNPNQTLIRILFNQIVPGKNQSLVFSLYHDGPTSHLSRNIFKIIIPKLSNPEQLAGFKVNIKTPKEFGNLAFSQPQPVNIYTDSVSGLTNLLFTGNQVLDEGISAIFGNFQTKKYFLGYSLNNSDSHSHLYSLVLPKDTPDQKVFIESIDPTPDNVYLDAGGNWFALYKLKSKSSQYINILGQVQLSNGFQDLILSNSDPDNQSLLIFPAKSGIYPDLYKESHAQLSISLLSPFQMFPFIENHGFIDLRNIGNESINITDFSVKAVGLEVIPSISDNLVVLPFGHYLIPVTIRVGLLETLFPKYLTITASGPFSITYNIPYNLFFIAYVIIVIFLTVSFLGTAVFAFRTWGLHLQKHRR